MEKINKQVMLRKLCKSFPGFRDCFVKNADDWVSLDGEFLWIILIGKLSGLIMSSIENGEYGSVENVFLTLEELLEGGDDEVVDLVCTGLLESMLNYRSVPQSLWRPILGRNSAKFCERLDRYYDS